MKGDLLHRLDYRTVAEMSADVVRPMLFGDRGSSLVLGLIKVLEKSMHTPPKLPSIHTPHSCLIICASSLHSIVAIEA